MKPLTHIVYLALIAALSVYAWSRSPSPEPVGETHTTILQPSDSRGVVTAEPTTEQTPAEPKPNPNDNEVILALMEVNEQLQQQLDKAQQQNENGEGERNRPRKAPSINDPLHDRLGLDPGRLFTDPNYLTEFLESRPRNFERDSHLELLLSDSFVTNEALRNLQTNTLRCHSSVCIVEINVSSLEVFNRRTLHNIIHSEHIKAAGGHDSLTMQDDNTFRMIIEFQDDWAN